MLTPTATGLQGRIARQAGIRIYCCPIHLGNRPDSEWSSLQVLLLMNELVTQQIYQFM
jgi:hypothetical protein